MNYSPREPGAGSRGASFAATSLAVLALLCLAEQATAQSLEQLIPEDAVENPEEWADQIQDPPIETAESAEGEPEAQQSPEPGGEEPELGWPDSGPIEFEKADPLEAGDTQIFADFGLEDLYPAVELATVRIADGVELGLPVDLADLPERDDLSRRFASRSTLRELESLDGNVAQVVVRAAEDEELLADILRLYGYYDGRVTQSIEVANGESSGGAGKPKVRFDIQPGRQFHIGEVNLAPLEEAGADYEALRAAFGVNSGDPVLADQIIAERSDLETALAQSGYPFAIVEEPSLLVDHERFEADLNMATIPNGKYRFGQVISGLPELLSSRHLASLALFEPGDVYDSAESLDLRRMVLGTGLVSRVEITPRAVTAPDGDNPGVVDLDIAMEQAPLRSIVAGLGYGTGEGFRVSGNWEHRNLFPPEGMLRLRGLLGTREALAGVTFQRRNLGGRNRILSVDLSADQEDRDAYNSRTVTLLSTYERKSNTFFRSKFSWGVGLELLVSDEREIKATGEQAARQTFLVGALPLNGQFDTSDDLLDPTQGFRVGLRLSPEISSRNGRSSTYSKVRLDAAAYQQIGDGPVLAARGALGSIFGADIGSIAPSRRFYAGGGGSVRGYGYEEIGPTDQLNQPNGGRSLAEFSLEARVATGLLDGALAIVPFVDAGTVNRESFPTFDNMRFGAGLGFRYKTAIGPLRIDFATPLNPRPQDGKIAVYVSLGQAF